MIGSFISIYLTRFKFSAEVIYSLTYLLRMVLPYEINFLTKFEEFGTCL